MFVSRAQATSVTGEEGGRRQVHSVAAALAVTEEDEVTEVEKLRGQLMTALSLLMSLGFDVIDLRDVLLT